MQDIKNDLNSKLFYKVQFTVKPAAGLENMDILWELVLHIKRWLSAKRIKVSGDIKRWSAFKKGGKLYDYSENGDFFAESVRRVDPCDPNSIAWACIIRERQYQQGYAPRWWSTEIGYQSNNGEAADLTFVLSYSDGMGYIGETMPEPEISVPRIVPNIQNDERFLCEINDDPLLFDAMELRTGEGFSFKQLLLDPKRKIPIILILPKRDYVDREKINLPVDPNEMIKSVGGNALVYYSMDLGFAEELKFLLDSNYKCTAGMIRLYLPQINRDNPNDYSRHRFIHFDEARKMSESVILKIFRRVLAQDINDYDDLFRYRTCLDLIRKDGLQAKLDKIKRDKELSEKVISEDNTVLAEKNYNLEEENIQLQIDNMDLEEQINELKKDIHGYKTRIDLMESSYESLRVAKEAMDGIRDLDEYPNTTMRVLNYFTTLYTDRIDLTEQGWKSLNDCNTSPDILWEVLVTMVTELYDCINNSGSFNEACIKYNERASCKCVPGNSSTTKKDKSIIKLYEDEYMGQKVNIEPHIASNTGKESDPRFYRIYFGTVLDKKTHAKKIIIGSCGGHMDTAGTKYQK
ncbi:hypothetical protein [Butyrivibrio sp. WCE2006]|uniref:hypothetical protein n=1 Tax=Butyrivibrio sp. WCE2006 TaxID=1410611 RepID=UPI0005D1580E|nr:hypothetical protein [Butyrivibrio sp. WCE2006]